MGVFGTTPEIGATTRPRKVIKRRAVPIRSDAIISRSDRSHCGYGRLYFVPCFNPFALELLEIIKFIDIGDFFNFENFISDSKLLPVPEIKTAVFIFLDPVNRAI